LEKNGLEIYHAKMLAKILLLTQVFSQEKDLRGFLRISILSRVELFLKEAYEALQRLKLSRKAGRNQSR
jgi:hypothetical protein